MVNEELRKELPEDAIIFDGPAYDNSIIGVSTDGRVVYDYNSMIKEVMQDSGMPEDEATDWINYNTARSIVCIGKNAPIIMVPINN